MSFACVAMLCGRGGAFMEIYSCTRQSFGEFTYPGIPIWLALESYKAPAQETCDRAMGVPVKSLLTTGKVEC